MREMPFAIPLSPEGFQKDEEMSHVQRRMSDLENHFSDHAAVKALLADSDPLVYEYWEREYDGTGQSISFGMTRIFPGCVGNEFHLTKGHFHADGLGDEIHFTLSGQGVVLLYEKDGSCLDMKMQPGKVNYFPGNYAHRTINTGDGPLVFVGFWPPKIVHDYGTIHQKGFPKLVVSGPDGPMIVDNPKFAI